MSRLVLALLDVTDPKDTGFSRVVMSLHQRGEYRHIFYVDPVSVGISVGVHSHNFVKIILLSANEKIPSLSTLASASAWCLDSGRIGTKLS